MLKKKRCIIVLLFFYFQGNVQANDELKFFARITLADKHGFPLKSHQEQFKCNDKIYAALQLENFPKGKHTFTVKWFNPNDDLQENTEYDFHITKKDTHLWSWIIFNRGKGANLMRWIDPSAGLEDFIGEWNVRFFIDHTLLTEKKVQVSC